jgi:hypothetical protein
MATVNDKSQRAETSSGDSHERGSLWWAIAEFLALAAVAVASGVIVYRMRPPEEATLAEAPDEPVGSPLTEEPPRESTANGGARLELMFATDADLAGLARQGPIRELLIEDSDITVTGLKHLVELTSLEHLRIRGAAIDDAGIEILCQLRQLRFLNLPQAQFTNAGLAALAELPELELLRFGSPNVSDDGLVHCQRMSRLRCLHLIDVPVSDTGLAHLKSLRHLESLYIDGSRVSDGAVETLLSALPDLHLHIDQRHHDRDPRFGSHEHGNTLESGIGSL